MSIQNNSVRTGNQERAKASTEKQSTDRHESGVIRALENHLTQQWEKILKVDTVNPQDNFFQLGGDSLRAAVCTYQLQNSMQEKIPLSAIFETQTIADYARYLENNFPEGVGRLLEIPTQVHQQIEKNIQQPVLVPIQPRGTLAPLFCIHPAGGIVFPYYTLSAFLDKDRPLYGVQDPSLYKSESQPKSIEIMARRYIAAIKSIQPEGPYYLLGWSAGGVIAYEMAWQLKEQGQPVAKLVIVDTAAPGMRTQEGAQPNQQDFLRLLLARIKTFPGQILAATTTLASIISYIRSGLYLLAATTKHDGASKENKLPLSALLGWVGLDTWRTLLLRRDMEIENTISQEQSLLLIRMPDVKRILQLVSKHQRLVKRYVTKSYPGKVVLFRGVDSIRERNSNVDATLGWGKLAKNGVEVHVIQANHVGWFIKPHVEVLAQELKNLLSGK